MTNDKPKYVKTLKPGETVELKVLLTLGNDGKTVGLSLDMPEQRGSIGGEAAIPLERVARVFAKSFARLIPLLFRVPNCAKSSISEQLGE